MWRVIWPRSGFQRVIHRRVVLSKASASNVSVRGFLLTAVLAAMALTLMFAANWKPSWNRASTQAKPEVASPGARARVQTAYAALPLAFEQNQGQTDERVKFMARTHDYTLFLTENEAVFSLQSGATLSRDLKGRGIMAADSNKLGGNKGDRAVKTAVVDMQLIGANPPAKIAAGDELPGKSNYFIGNDPKKWHSNVPQFARVSYEEVYPGVSLAFHGAQRQLEFDFVVAANAEASPIAFRLSGAKNIKTDSSGDLVISSVAGDVRFHKPAAYQQINGTRQGVDASFALTADNKVGFQLGNYDHSRELVIDPSVTVAYATYLGGNAEDDGYGIAVDSSGNAYVTGQTASTNFPVVSGSYSTTNGGILGIFVTKISPAGVTAPTLLYSSYIGGTDGNSSSGNAIAVDASGDAFVAGGTASANFPVAPNPGAIQTSLRAGASGNAFALKLNPGGTALLYSTYLGGSTD